MDDSTAGGLGGHVGVRVASDALLAAYTTIVAATVERSPGTDETPARAAAAWRELTAGYDVDVPGLFKLFDAESYDEMVAVAGVPFSSLCEHHLLPFVGLAHVVYLPSDRIVGLSKIPRVVDAFARRLQNQERLTVQIADAIEQHLEPRGVLVMCEAEHSCMALRGVKSAGTMRTSVTRGAMRDKPATRAEALALIGKGC